MCVRHHPCCCGGERKLHISQPSCRSKLPVFGGKVRKVVAKLGWGWGLRPGRLPPRWGVKLKCTVMPQLEPNSSDRNRYFFSCRIYISHLKLQFGQTFWAVERNQNNSCGHGIKAGQLHFAHPVKSRSAKSRVAVLIICPGQKIFGVARNLQKTESISI